MAADAGSHPAADTITAGKVHPGRSGPTAASPPPSAGQCGDGPEAAAGSPGIHPVMHLHGGPHPFPGRSATPRMRPATPRCSLAAELPLPVENLSLLHRQVAVNAFDVRIKAIRHRLSAAPASGRIQDRCLAERLY